MFGESGMHGISLDTILGIIGAVGVPTAIGVDRLDVAHIGCQPRGLRLAG
jgi:hypothetical protein